MKSLLFFLAFFTAFCSRQTASNIPKETPQEVPTEFDDREQTASTDDHAHAHTEVQSTDPEEEGIFAFAKLKINSTRRGQLNSGHKFETAKKIFDDLVNARSDKRLQRPEFVMSRRERYVAWMNAKKVEIGLEETAYDICTSFGPDSLKMLAALLSHEVSHYYERHNWKKHFVRSNEQLKTSELLDGLDEGVRNETEADYIGGFLAYSAGYNTLKTMPRLLKAIYETYDLPNEIEGYPSLQDRQGIVENADKELQKLIELFEMANYLSAIGSYEIAADYYKVILQQYQSREIYNNLGINLAMYAISNFFTEKELPYFFPLEIDLNFRGTSKDGSMGFGGRIAQRRELLQEAIQNFNYAITLDENYAPAYLNKACIYAILEDIPRARFYAAVEALDVAKKDQVTNENTLINIKVLRGIIAALEHDQLSKAGQVEEAAEKRQEAIGFFNSAMLSDGSTIAKANKNTFLGEPDSESDSRSSRLVGSSEAIEGAMSLDDFRDNLDPELFRAEVVPIAHHSQFAISDSPENKVKYFCNIFNEGEAITYFKITDPNFEKTTSKGISIGMSQAAIEADDKYGKASKIVPTTTGQILVYNQRSGLDTEKFMLFFLEKNKLKRWCLALQEMIEE